MTTCVDCDAKSLEEQIKALKDLIEVAQTVVSTLDLDTVLQAILTSAISFAGMPAGSIALYDEKHHELTLQVYQGLSADFVKIDRWQVARGGLNDHVLQSREMLFVDDTAQAPYFSNPVAVKEGIRSLVAVPLTVKQKTVGVLYLDDFAPRVFDREKMKLISILATFAAMAIDNAQLHNRTKLMAITDYLTGLHNHRHFRQVFSLELSRARRYKNDLSIIIMDIDDFKKFNDTYGHPVGDRILATLGGIVSRALRNVDHAFRYGGEEFVVLLPETPLESAIQVAERLREAIEQNSRDKIDGLELGGVTVSVGVASYPRNGASGSEILKKVDDLLYRAKEFGKNRVYYDETRGE